MYCSIQYYIIFGRGASVQTRVFWPRAKIKHLASARCRFLKNQAPRCCWSNDFWWCGKTRRGTHHPTEEAFACKGNRLVLHPIEKRWLHFQLFFVHRPVKESISSWPGGRVLKTEHGAWCLSSSGKANATFFCGDSRLKRARLDPEKPRQFPSWSLANMRTDPHRGELWGGALQKPLLRFFF